MKPKIVFLHFLGGSALSWATVMHHLQADALCVAVDLAGFGSAAANTGHSVAEMADAVAAVVRNAPAQRWGLVGHSMGAKIASVVARRAEAGESGLGGLDRIVLLAGSPPSPEPMPEVQRAEMLGWFGGDAHDSEAQARRYIDQNIGRALPAERYAQAVSDVTNASTTGWRAWLNHGSREDWSDRVGVLQTPALIVAGEADGPLGPEGQARFSLPHYANARMATLADSKHLLPYEQPTAVARLIAEHFA